MNPRPQVGAMMTMIKIKMKNICINDYQVPLEYTIIAYSVNAPLCHGKNITHFPLNITNILKLTINPIYCNTLHRNHQKQTSNICFHVFIKVKLFHGWVEMHPNPSTLYNPIWNMDTVRLMHMQKCTQHRIDILQKVKLFYG